MRTISSVAIVVCVASLVVLSACSSKKSSKPSPTKTAALTAGPTGTQAATVAPTESGGVTLPKLTNVAITSVGDHDRIEFTFDKSVATPHVDSPTDSPTYCASGEAVPVTGQYLLEVRFTGADAHNEDGTSSVAQTSIQADLPAVLEATQTCDFEGTVTWLVQIRSQTPVERSKDAGTMHTVDVTHP